MKTVSDLNQELEALENELTELGKPVMERAKKLKAELVKAYGKKFDENEYLKEKMNAVMNTKELTCVENDDCYSQWERIDFDKVIDVESVQERENLETYLEENDGIRADFKNDCLTYGIGQCIVIYDDGDIWDQDSQKRIAKGDEIESDEERNVIIEAWMEKSGCFPSVVAVDRYGSPFGYVDTKGKNDK